MKYFYWIIITIFTSQISNSQTIDIPDTNFKNALINLGIDTNSDSDIQISEAITVTSLNVSSKNITSLVGIEYFINLEQLRCYSNNLTSIDLSNLINLNHLSCSYNQLDNLDFTGLDNITTIFADNNQFTSLDFSPLINLQNLYLANNQLTLLDLTNNPIAVLSCSGNTPLTYLYLKNETPLVFSYPGAPPASGFGNCPNLRFICVDDGVELNDIQAHIDYLGYSNCEVSTDCLTKTQTINIPDANFKNALLAKGVDISNDGEIQIYEAELITTLNVTAKNIASMEGVQYFTYLETLACNDNSIANIDVSTLTNLKNLHLEKNQIASIDLSTLINLEVLSVNRNLLTSLNVSVQTKLQYLYANNNLLTDINFNGLTDLLQLDVSYNQLNELTTSSLSSLKNLNCSSNALETLNLGTLNDLDFLWCGNNELTELDVTGLPNLVNFACNTNKLTTLDLSNFFNLENFNCQDNLFNSLDFNTLINLKYLTSAHNNFTNIDVSCLSNLEYLVCGYNLQLTSLIIKNNSTETTLNIAGSPNLTNICSDTNEINTAQSLVDSYGYTCTVDSNCNPTGAQIVNIVDINLKNALVNTNCVDTNNDGIADVNADFNNDGEIQVCEAVAISNLIFAPISQESFIVVEITGLEYFTNLRKLDFGWVKFYDALNLSTAPKDLDVSFLSKLKFLSLNQAESFNLETINLSGLTNLNELHLVNIRPQDPINGGLNNFVNVMLEGCYNLEYLNYFNSYLNIDFCQIPSLKKLDCHYLEGGELDEFDFSCLVDLEWLDISENEIKTLILKNSSILTHLEISKESSDGYSTEYICIDDFNDEYNQVINLVDDTTVVNSFCSFTPGGEYYTFEGKISIDVENNGCDINDNPYPNVKFNISNGEDNGDFISNASGNFNFPLQKGTYTITPILENLDYFSITPQSLTISFPDDGSPFIQNFCLAPNGIKNDLEITILPLSQARPGFNTYYRLNYKNKGNTTLSGSINLNFQDDLLDFISSSPNIASQSTNNLNWDYFDLAPFETQSILFTLNVNSPVESPAVNNGDVLTLTSTINPLVDDENQTDNTFTLNQTVVGSYDPNDKTCLEGNIITPDLIGEYVHYLIRCENTGTAEAVNIVIKDSIDTTKFDMSSILITASSHDMITKINDSIVEFIFENINLPFDDANNDAYVAFKIKTLSTLQIRDSFENEAEIYFDYNFPIITNIAQTSIENSLGTDDFEASDNLLRLFPNPVEDICVIESKNYINLISIYDLSGRLISKFSYSGFKTNHVLSTKNLTSGSYFIKIKTNKNSFVKKLIKK